MLRVDSELEALIPPLRPEEYKRLRENIERDGRIIDPIKIWRAPEGDTIVDGHNRWSIYLLLADKIPAPDVVLLPLITKGEVVDWMKAHQRGRRNLSPDQQLLLDLQAGAEPPGARLRVSQAKNLLDHAPALAEDVAQGRKTLAQAWNDWWRSTKPPAPTPSKASRALQLETENKALKAEVAELRSTPKTSLIGGTKVRIIIPDSHGAHIDIAARDACLRDIRSLSPSHIVFLGDHLDCAGTFSAHQRTYTNEMAESYEDDVQAAIEFLDLVQKAAPSCKDIDYLEGNHEQHVERWAARNFQSQKDAEALLKVFGPEKALDLERRGIRYFKRSVQYDGVAIPGCIRRGKCHFVHGISHSKHAAATHLARFGSSVVFGHIHRSQSVVERSVTATGFGAWCPGTLAKLQPLYKHTEPTSWSHGYGVQFINTSGNFIHINIPILDGESMLAALLKVA